MLGGHKGLYRFGWNVPTSSSLLLVLPALGLQYGLQTGERGRGSQVSGERSERVLRARLPLSRVLMPCSFCPHLPIMGRPASPFIGEGKAWVTKEEKEKNERERKRLLGLPGPSSPSYRSRRSCRCQQGRFYIVALFVASAMRRRHLLVMASQSVLTGVVVN